jgi:hypothetical protein
MAWHDTGEATETAGTTITMTTIPTVHTPVVVDITTITMAGDMATGDMDDTDVDTMVPAMEIIGMMIIMEVMDGEITALPMTVEVCTAICRYSYGKVSSMTLISFAVAIPVLLLFLF